jgi:hypothetical protein
LDRRGSYFASIGYSLVVVNRIVDASPISPRAIRQVRGLLKAFEGVGILAHEEHVRGGMRIAFGVTLISLLKGSQVDAELACDYGAKATQFPACARDEFRVSLQKWSEFHLLPSTIFPFQPLGKEHL